MIRVDNISMVSFGNKNKDMERLNKLRNAKHDFFKFNAIKQGFYLINFKKPHEKIIL